MSQKLKVLVALLALLLWGEISSRSTALASETERDSVDCARFRPQMLLLSRAQEFSLIGIQALDPTLRNLHTQEIEREQLRRLRTQIERTVPEQCRDEAYRRASDTWQIRISQQYGQFVAAQGLSMDGISYLGYRTVELGNRYRYDFHRPPCAIPWFSDDQTRWDNYFECIHTNAESSSSSFINDLRQMTSADEFNQKMIARYGPNHNSIDQGEFEVLRAFFINLYSSENTAAFFTNSEHALNNLSSDQKAIYVAAYGVYLDWGYDYSRLHGRTIDSSAINAEQIFQAARNNFFEEAWVDQNTNQSSHWQRAGVCRDIASAQGELLESIGFKNVFTVALQTTDGGHVAVIAQDPNNPNTTYGFNYGTMNENNRTAAFGNAAVVPPTSPDSNLTDAVMNVYRLYRPAGPMVTSVQSEMGIWLAQLAGVAPNDPLARIQYPNSVASIRSTRMGTEIRGGFGRDVNGNPLSGIGVTQSWGTTTRSPGQAGVILASRTDLRSSAAANEVVNLNVLYLYLEQNMNSRTFQLTDRDLQLRIETRFQGMFSTGRIEGGSNDGSRVYDGDGRITLNLRLDQGSVDTSRFSSTYRAGLQLTGGTTDVRRNLSWPILVMQHLLFSAEGRLRLSRSPEGQAYLLAATTVLVDYLGMRGRAILGLATQNVTASAYAEGRMVGFHDGGVPLWQPSSQRRIGATLEAHTDPRRARRQVSLFTTGSIAVDPETPRDVRVLGGLNLTLDPSRRR